MSRLLPERLSQQNLDDFQVQLKLEASNLASSFPLTYWRDKDGKAEYPWEFLQAFAEGGWLGLTIPTHYGGSGLGISEASLMLHAIAESGAGTSGTSPVHFFIFPFAPIIRHGSAAMKERYLPRAAKGELLVAFGVTEPNAGSDTSRIETFARRDGDGWLISGQKVWTTNAQHAERILLLARTSPRNPERPLEGMTLFFPALDRSSCTIRLIEKLGRAAVDSNEVFIDDLRADDDDVVGEVGRGFYHLVDALNPERIVIAMESAGIGRAALRLATQYAKARTVFDRPIGSNQAVAHPLAQSWAELEAVELLALKAAAMFDRGEACANEATAAKYLAAEAGFQACDAALQVFGGFGYSREYHIERLWREMRLYRIAPLSQELALNYLARHALGLGVR